MRVHSVKMCARVNGFEETKELITDFYEESLDETPITLRFDLDRVYIIPYSLQDDVDEEHFVTFMVNWFQQTHGVLL